MVKAKDQGAAKEFKIGVLSIQGDVSEHFDMIKAVGAQPVPVRRPYEVEIIDGLILPGGESTTLGLLMKQSGLDQVIQKRANEGMPVWGTCMGAILLAKRLLDNQVPQTTLGLMDISIRRNAYGRQKDSFEEEVPLQGVKGESFPCIFIRAPWIEEVGPQVVTMGTFRGKIILAREKNLLASAFHPEIAKDERIHQFFLEMIKDRGSSN